MRNFWRTGMLPSGQIVAKEGADARYIGIGIGEVGAHVFGFGHKPQLLWFPGSCEEPMRVAGRAHIVLFAVNDQNRTRRDLPDDVLRSLHRPGR